MAEIVTLIFVESASNKMYRMKQQASIEVETSPRVLGSCDQATSLNLMSSLKFKHQLQILDSTSYASSVLNLWLVTRENPFQAQSKNLPQTHGRTKSLLELLIIANQTIKNKQHDLLDRIIAFICFESKANNTMKLLERSKPGSSSEAQTY